MKIKMNWGTGLVIGMLLFISFIMYFVVTMMSSTKFDHDLVVEDYYKAELHYQEDIDAETNALSLDNNLILQNNNGALKVLLPEDMEPGKIKGKIALYRPSNKMLDFSIPLGSGTREILIPDSRLIPGRWNVIVNWSYGGKDYLFKKEIVY